MIYKRYGALAPIKQFGITSLYPELLDGIQPSERVINMLTLEQKVQFVLWVAPFLAFGLGVMWQKATQQLEQE